MEDTNAIKNEQKEIQNVVDITKDTTERPLNILEWIGTLFLLLTPGLNIFSGLIFLILRRKNISRSNFVMACSLLIVSFIIMIGITIFICGDTLRDFIWDLFNRLYF